MPCLFRAVNNLPWAKYTTQSIQGKLLTNFWSNQMMNIYFKYCANVFLAKCEDAYDKGDTIDVVTSYGKINECIVFNLIAEKAGFYYYSIIRADGFNAQKQAKAKIDKLEGYAAKAERRSAEWHKKSHEGGEFLTLGEPIKVGHHSEKRHRALIDRNWNRIGNAVAESEKAKYHLDKAKYWESRTEVINLSMPESIEYYQFKLQEAKKCHADLKGGIVEKTHSMSLQYAKKAVNDLEKKYDLAHKLWG